MDFITKLAASIFLIKMADEVRKDKSTKAQVRKWDRIAGLPAQAANADYTNPALPNTEDMPTDIGYNNKQTISGTGHGALIFGRYRNGNS